MMSRIHVQYHGTEDSALVLSFEMHCFQMNACMYILTVVKKTSLCMLCR